MTVGFFSLVPDLTERQIHQQTALWELIKTEVAYIKTLKVVTDVSDLLFIQLPFFFFLSSFRCLISSSLQILLSLIFSATTSVF